MLFLDVILNLSRNYNFKDWWEFSYFKDNLSRKGISCFGKQLRYFISGAKRRWNLTSKVPFHVSDKFIKISRTIFIRGCKFILDRKFVFDNPVDFGPINSETINDGLIARKILRLWYVLRLAWCIFELECMYFSRDPNGIWQVHHKYRLNDIRWIYLRPKLGRGTERRKSNSSSDITTNGSTIWQAKNSRTNTTVVGKNRSWL